MLRVLNPTATAAVQKGRLAVRLDTLTDKTIGVLWNSRPLGDRILTLAAGLLKERHGLKDVIFVSKPFFGNVASAEILQQLVARRIDAAITGVGD